MAKKPNQPDADDKEKNKKKGAEGHEDEQEQDDEDDESDAEGSGDERDADDEDESPSDDEDTSQWSPEKTKNYVKKLRKENARYRKLGKESKTELATLRQQITGIQNSVAKALGLKEGEELTPEQQAEALSGQLTANQFKTAVLEAAYGYGVPPDSRDYFEYLIQKEVSGLEEGEELDEETLEKLAKKAMSGNGGKKKGFSTSISNGAGRRRGDDEDSDEDDDSDESNDPPPSKGHKGLTAESFAEMGTSAKMELYNKNPGLYERLMAEARRKNLLKTY